MKKIDKIVSLSEKKYIEKIEEIIFRIGFTAEDKNLKKIVDIFEMLKNKFYDAKNGYQKESTDFYFNRIRLLNKEIMKIDRPIAEIERIRTEFGEIYSDYLDNKLMKKFDEYDKKILEMMGIFLTIFSIIGLGVSSILKLESNYVATWLMICGTILITMTGLFTLINKKIEIMKILVIIIGLVLFGVGGIIRCTFPEENKELVKQEDFKLVKDDVNNVKNITNTEDAQINNLKVEIEKLKSKIEELENNKSKNRK
jgi:hypothetical protein